MFSNFFYFPIGICCEAFFVNPETKMEFVETSYPTTALKETDITRYLLLPESHLYFIPAE